MAKATVAPVLVTVQTLRAPIGTDAAYAFVEKAVKAHNAANPKAVHAVKRITVLPLNTKGMQWQLSLHATVARLSGCNLIRLAVHGGECAVSGPKDAIAAYERATVEASNAYIAAYNAAQGGISGNGMAARNAYLCGCPAGLQQAGKVAPTVAYGIGYLWSMPAPGDAYTVGQLDAAKLGTAVLGKPVSKPATARKPKAAQPAVEAPAVEAPAVEQTA